MPGPILSRWLPAAYFLGFWGVLAAGGRSRLLRDPGTFWHTAVGDRILAVGFFDTDPYSFTFAGARWIPHQWLGEMVMAVIYRLAGLDGLVTVTAAALAAVFAGIAVRFVRVGFHPLAALLFAVAALAVGANHFHARPHLATIAGMAVTIMAVVDIEAGRVRLRRLWWLVPVSLVWSNTHGGMLGGLATLGLAGAGWAVALAAGRWSPFAGGRDVAEFAAVWVACGLTAFVTPYGADIPRTWLAIMAMPRLREVIQEHAPPDFAEPSAWATVGLAAAYLLLLAGTRPRDWRASWGLPLVWMALAFGRVRHAPLFAVVTCVVAADVWPATRWASWLVARRPEYYDPTRRPVGGTRAAVVIGGVWVAVVLAVQAAGIHTPVVGAGWAEPDPDHWPVGLLPALKRYEPRPPEHARLFNELQYGGFVIRYAPGYRVFVDDRCELYGEDWLVRYAAADTGDFPAAVADWESRYGRFDFALTVRHTAADRYFRDRPAEWERVDETATAAFYRRRS